MRLQLPNRNRKLLSILRRRPQHMKRESLSALRSNPRQLPELINQPSHRLRKPRHQRNPGRSGRPSPPIIPATLALMASSARRPASFTAAVIRSSSNSRSLPALPIADASIFSRRTSFFPFIRTVTTPPPLDASTTVSDSLRSICSCIWRACPIISFIFPRSEKSMRSSSLVVVPQIDHVANLSIEQPLCLLDDGMLHGLCLRAAGLRRPGLLLLGCSCRPGEQHQLQCSRPSFS